MKTTNSNDISFEDMKYVSKNGTEYWLARELMQSFGYVRWESFETLIGRARTSCDKSGNKSEDHFRQVTKMVQIGKMSKTERFLNDWAMDRYACYLLAQNGDSKKVQIAKAQSYFAIQTRIQELQNMDKVIKDNEKRLFIREEVKKNNKELFSTAKKAGVTNFGFFNDAGYVGLYGMKLSSVESLKNIPKGELLDVSGSTELAANLFRITQTDEKIKKENIKGQANLQNAHFMVGGKIRQTIKDIGGVTPEKLKKEVHIKEIKKSLKKLK